MISKNKFRARVLYTTLTLMVTTLIIFGCVYLDGVVVEKSTANAGEIVKFTMKVRTDTGDPPATRLIVAMLAPKSWKVAENTVVTYTHSAKPDDTYTMQRIPLDEHPRNMNTMTWPDALRSRFGYGPNVLEDMEWVAYQSREIHKLSGVTTADVVFSVKVGPENMVVRPCFFLNHSDDGLSTDDKHFKFQSVERFYVENGEEPFINFCDLLLNAVVPSSATKDDILTIKYQGAVRENALDDVDEIYLNATATTTSGKTYSVTEKSDKTQMTKEMAFGRDFSITLWPVSFFGIPEDETLTKIDYYFTNDTETLVVKDDSDEIKPFKFTFMCK